MTRESVHDKAHRYLIEGRLVVTAVNGDTVRAVCRGHEPGRGWFCSCPVRTDRCSHLIALRSVTVRRSA